MEKIIKPEELDIGMRFRLTGDACNEKERNDTQVYEVINKNLNYKIGAHLIVRSEAVEIHTEMKIMPWVRVLLVEK